MLLPVLDKPFINRRLFNYLSNHPGLSAYWPLDDANAFSRVINPAVALGRNLAINGTFAADTDWTKGTGWTIAAGVATATAAPAGGTGNLTQAITGLVVGKSYEVTYTISGYSAGTIRVLVGNTGLGTTRSANGTFTETIVCGSNTTLTFQVTLQFTGNIDNVTVKQVSILASTSYPSAELLTDGNMETAGVAAWTVQNSATLTKDTGSPHGGTQNLRVARNGVNNPGARQLTILTIGKRYRLTGWVRSDGSATPTVTDGTNTMFTGTTSTSWQAIDQLFIATGTEIRFSVTTSTGTQYAEYDDFSVTEVNPLTGVDSGPTAGISAGSRLQVAKSFDGVNDYINVYSADLNSVWTPDEFTLFGFFKVSAVGVWTDATLRYFVRLSADGNNEAVLRRSTTNNTLVVSYIAGGTSKSVTPAFSGLDYFMLAMTVSKSAAAGSGELIAYLNGVQSGSIQNALGTFVGNLATTTTVLGALNTSGTNPMSGFESHVGLASRALTAAEILTIAQKAGVAA